MDPINGDGGNNNLDGTSGDDIINGLGGDDIINSSLGADTIDGGDGIDTLDYSASSAGFIFTNLANGFGGDAQGGSFVNIEVLTGSAFNDRIDINGNFDDGMVFDLGAGDDIFSLEGDNNAESVTATGLSDVFI